MLDADEASTMRQNFIDNASLIVAIFLPLGIGIGNKKVVILDNRDHQSRKARVEEVDAKKLLFSLESWRNSGQSWKTQILSTTDEIIDGE